MNPDLKLKWTIDALTVARKFATKVGRATIAVAEFAAGILPAQGVPDQRPTNPEDWDRLGFVDGDYTP